MTQKLGFFENDTISAALINATVRYVSPDRLNPAHVWHGMKPPKGNAGSMASFLTPANSMDSAGHIRHV